MLLKGLKNMKKWKLCTLVFLIFACLFPLCCASAEDFRIPDFASYAAKQIVETETYDGMTIYTLSRADWNSVLGSYSGLLESDYGFQSIQAQKVDSVAYVWFADHASVPAETLDALGLEGTCSFLFACSDIGNDLVQVILLPGGGFVMEDTGERYDNPKPANTPKPTETPKPGKPCDKCDGTGDCQNCGGDMWYEGYKYVTKWKWKNGEYTTVTENEYVTELCDDDNCHGGSCKACGGDGVI